MMDKVRQAVNANDKAKAEEQEQIRQDAERRAWLRELEQTDSEGFYTLITDERGKNGLQNTRRAM